MRSRDEDRVFLNQINYTEYILNYIILVVILQQLSYY